MVDLSGFSGVNSAVTAAAAALTSTPQVCRTLIVQADSGNADSVYVGFGGTANYEMAAGALLTLSGAEANQPDIFIDVSKLTVKAKSGTQTVRWLGLNL